MVVCGSSTPCPPTVAASNILRDPNGTRTKPLQRCHTNPTRFCCGGRKSFGFDGCPKWRPPSSSYYLEIKTKQNSYIRWALVFSNYQNNILNQNKIGNQEWILLDVWPFRNGLFKSFRNKANVLLIVWLIDLWFLESGWQIVEFLFIFNFHSIHSLVESLYHIMYLQIAIEKGLL